MKNEPLVFELGIAKDKPHSYRKTSRKPVCPFCEVDQLTAIYEKRGEMIWLHNKFPTLRDTVQTVLIESSDHTGDIANYPPAYNRELMRFALACFTKMNDSGKYRSVLWYKNYGPRSGGSLEHPHMQLVGLKQLDGYKYLQQNNFAGISLFNNQAVEVNIATHPVQGYDEININLLKEAGLDLWADWIQSGVKYMLNIMFNGRCTSYNLFFYPREDGGICAKLIARFEAPAYFVGYKLSQVDDEKTLQAEARQFRRFFDNGSPLE
ncbi:DUF4931 domain-containing protein [Lactobacillus sp. ESL0701]|uniref:DUF4931 domain-containing protein n=1 Tax=Lactobacillus sp. ESL0701 TaxID=2983217 RepID=UPI0023F90D96|nr:DUF4931 domain-containing protein [Lactobacillus sp. ESL0701]MDF7672817.1 DUF4931 domain-containing protein [Lactobacillus sp. ESL0701]